MMAELYLDETNNRILGKVTDFKIPTAFMEAIRNDNKDMAVKVISVEKKMCIISQSGLAPESIMVIDDTDVEIVWCFIATINSNL